MTPRQQRFVDEYPLDLNATQAAIRAGFSPRTAASAGSRMLRNVEIQAAVTLAGEARALRTEVTVDWITQQLRENVAKAMQHVEVRDRRGRPTGTYVYQGMVANVALRTLAEMIGGLKPQGIDLTSDGKPFEQLSDDERALRVVALLDRARARRAGCAPDPAAAPAAAV